MNACSGQERVSASPPAAPHVIEEVGVETWKGQGTLLGKTRFFCELQTEASLEVEWSLNEVAPSLSSSSLSPSLRNYSSVSSTLKWG